MGTMPARGGTTVMSDSSHAGLEAGASAIARVPTRRGKAPPIDSFTAEDRDTRLEDWLPTLERAATVPGIAGLKMRN